LGIALAAALFATPAATIEFIGKVVGDGRRYPAVTAAGARRSIEAHRESSLYDWLPRRIRGILVFAGRGQEDESGCPDRKWKKGQSGNPKGPDKWDKPIREALLEHAPQAVARLVELMRSEDQHIALAAVREILALQDNLWVVASL
jgi:hypothetical protein